MLEKIFMNAEIFNEIMDMGKKFADSQGVNISTRQIHIRVENNLIYASAYNGIRMCSIVFPCVEKTPDGSMTIPICDKVKKNVIWCEISTTDTEVRIKTASGVSTIIKENVEFVNCKKLLPKKEPREVFYFDSKNLADALSVFKGKVRLEYYGQLEPLVIEQSGKKAIVLPMRP